MGIVIVLAGFILVLALVLAIALVVSISTESSGESGKVKIKRLRNELKTQTLASTDCITELKESIAEMEAKILELKTENTALRLGLPMPTVVEYEAKMALKAQELRDEMAQRLDQIAQAYERDNNRGTKE